jgi:general L-amino acid transport system substrate-binding protein
MRLVSFLLCLIGLWCWIVPGSAESIVERVKERGLLYCGGVARPGLADQSGAAGWHGLEIDMGRAVAAAVLGSPDKVEFHVYATDADFVDGAKSDDILFLTGAEIAEHHLAGLLVPGPPVFVESQGVMVPGDSDIRHLQDLKNRTVCFFIGSPSERGLNAFSSDTGCKVFRRPFSEVGEMVDAYAARNCQAMVGEITDLAAIRNEDEVRHLASRILPETLEDFPLIAATGTADAKWSSLVAWTLYTLISGERRATPWFAGGADAMPLDAPELGLAEGWQSVVLKAVGNYGDIFQRNAGAGSPLNLERGSTENRLKPGILQSPYIE